MNSFLKAALAIALGIGAFALTGCGSSPKPTVGFLSTYDNLEEANGRLIFVNSERMQDFDNLMIDPVEVVVYDGSRAERALDDGRLTQEEINEVGQYGREAMERELTRAGFEITREPGPRTLRWRGAITDIKEATPALNILPQTKATGLGAGELSIEAEAVDSMTGEQVAAIVDTRSGQFLWVTAGMTEMGDARRAIDGWAETFARRMSDARDAAQRSRE